MGLIADRSHPATADAMRPPRDKMTYLMRLLKATALAMLQLSFLPLHLAHAEDFFAGKTITMSTHSERGGSLRPMTSPVSVSIPHHLGKEEALRRIKGGFGILRAHLGTLISI